MKKPIILTLCTALSVASLSSGAFVAQQVSRADNVYAYSSHEHKKDKDNDKDRGRDKEDKDKDEDKHSDTKNDRHDHKHDRHDKDEDVCDVDDFDAEEFENFDDVDEDEAVAKISEDGAHLAEDVVTTKHTGKIQGKSIDYTATAGTMQIEVNGETADMFFVAYTVEPEEEDEDRPITFAFNGGPGAASHYINFGCLGPRRVELDEKGSPVSMPAKYLDNENSILDMTDLVFIDPVGTGYSRPTNPDALEEFIGYENDLASMGEFIRLYTNRYDRWSAKKYLAGESYGTARAVGLCDYLRNTYALDVNGLMLFSSANDYSAMVYDDSNEKPYLLIFPTLAADAWYHKELATKYQKKELEDFLDEVREFVSTDLSYGLFMGDRLTKPQKENLAEKMADYTGLSKDYILKHNLRISLEDFRNELLSDRNLSLGRFDGRITGPLITDPMSDTDPSSSDLDIAFGNTFADYVTRELKYKTDIPYLPLSYEINGLWEFPEYQTYLAQEKTIYGCLARNKFLKIWVNCGYYDGATPFYAAEYTYSHVFANDDQKDNVQFTYYPSGHMFYVEKESFDQFREAAEDWFTD